MGENETTVLSQSVRHQSVSATEPYSRRLKLSVLLPPLKLAKMEEKWIGEEKRISKCQVVLCHHMLCLKEILQFLVGWSGIEWFRIELLTFWTWKSCWFIKVFATRKHWLEWIRFIHYYAFKMYAFGSVFCGKFSSLSTSRPAWSSPLWNFCPEFVF